MDLERLSVQLRELSKDEAAFEKLKQLFLRLHDERQEVAQKLRLLESAIRDDYGAIMITELNIEKPGPKIVYVNDGFCQMTGYERDEVIGKTPRLLQGPKTDRRVLDRLKSQLNKGQTFFGYSVNYRKDGSEFINQWDIHPLMNEDDKITHWVSYQHDITERKHAEKTFMDIRSAFEQLREDSARTILDIDPEGNIVQANKSFRKLTGFDKEELSHSKVWELFPDKYRQSLQARLDEVKHLGSLPDEPMRGVIKHRSGIPIQVEGRARVVNLKDQTLIRAVIRNISLQKRVAEALDRCRKDEELLSSKGTEFSYRMVAQGGDFSLEYVSEEFPVVTGIEEESVRRDGFSTIVHDDDLQTLRDHLLRVCEGRSHTCEYRIQTQYGDYLEVMDYGRPQKHHQDPSVLCVKGSVRVKESGLKDVGSRSIH